MPDSINPRLKPVSELRLSDVATADVLTVPIESGLIETIGRLAARDVSSVVVVKGLRPVGILTERDVLRACVAGLADDQPVTAAMSLPVTTDRGEVDFAMAMSLLTNGGVRHLVLIDPAGRLTGIASETDFRRHLERGFFEGITSLHAVMEPGIEMLRPDQSLGEAIRVMAATRLDHVLVGVEGRAAGIVTERDIPRLAVAHPQPDSVVLGDVMSQPLKCVTGDTPAADAAERMQSAGLRHLVVNDASGRLIGVINQHRLLERLSMGLLASGRTRLADQLNILLEATGLAVWEYDVSRDVLIRAANLNSLIPLSENRIIESLGDALKRIHADDQHRVARLFGATVAGERQDFNVDYRVPLSSGAVRWISARGKVVERASDGTPRRIAGVAIDIDDQKQSELALRRSESRFRALLANIPLPLFHVDGKGRIVFTNRLFTEVFGYAQDEIPDLAAWWARAFPEENYRLWALDHWNNSVQHAATTQTVIRGDDYQITCKDGSTRVVAVSGIAVGDEFLATFNDVTERREQQQLLEFSNAVLNHVSLGAAPAVVLDYMCRDIESRYPGMCCSVVLVDPESESLMHVASSTLPAAFRARVDGCRLGELVGTCGAAIARREPVYVGDIAQDPLWKNLRDIAMTAGLAACWSTPILAADGAPLGAFVIYWSQTFPAISDAAAREVGAGTALASIAIESHRRLASLHNLHELFARAEEIGQMGSWTIDCVSGKYWWSPQLYQLFGLDPDGEPPKMAEFIKFVHPEDQALVGEVMQALQGGVVPPNASQPYRRHPDIGPACHLRPTLFVLRDERGRVTGYQGTVADVTGLVQAETRGRAQLAELRRWQQIMLGRESRVLELKEEVNALLQRLGEAPRYQSVVGAKDGDAA